MRQTKLQKLKQGIKDLQDQIHAMQLKCKHPTQSVDVKHCGSTGGWDADTYWTENRCKKCDKFWIEDK